MSVELIFPALADCNTFARVEVQKVGRVSLLLKPFAQKLRAFVVPAAVADEDPAHVAASTTDLPLIS